MSPPGTADPQGLQRRGLGTTGQTTVFDNLFNPAVSLIGDLVLTGSDQRDSYATANRFVLRDVELGIVGRIDPLASYQVYLHFDEDAVAIEEAYLLADDWLPATFMLKAGRYNIDFGKLAPIHEHDLPFLDKPQVLQEYLGGALRGTGIELHHNFAVGGAALLRWSLGIVDELDGDAHAIFGPRAGGHEHGDNDSAEPFGSRNLENFACTARASMLSDVGAEGTLQLGVSAAYAPAAASFFDTAGGAVRAELRSLVLGCDVTYKTLDPSTGRGLGLGFELLHTRNDVTEDGIAFERVAATGGYGYSEYLADRYWSFGLSGGWFEHREDREERSWDAGAFVTWRFNEFNRLRLEARHFDDPGEEWFGVALQWTVILGTHGHNIDW